MSVRIAELSDGQTIESFFLIAGVREAATRSGSLYLTVDLRDRTGNVAGRIWDPAAVCPSGITEFGPYLVSGRVDSYRGTLQLVISGLSKLDPTDQQLAEMVKTSQWSPKALVGEIRDHVRDHVRSRSVHRLLLAVIDHPEVTDRLPISPAAVTNHHAFVGGLVEHTLSMLRLATIVADHYSAYYPGMIDRDILIAGVICHDLGKIWELSQDLAPSYTDDGQLLGHIPMAANFVAQVAEEIGEIPPELVREVQHMILSHHGRLEYGSPVVPRTIEAMLLHFIDQMDSKTNQIVSNLGEPGWSDWVRGMDRKFLNPAEHRRSWAATGVDVAGDHGPGRRYGAMQAARTVKMDALPDEGGKRRDNLNLFDGLD